MDDFPLFHLIFLMLWFSLLLAWLWLLVSLVTDVLRRDDISGWSKALWTIFIVILPWVGCLVYLIAHGSDMSARKAKQQYENEKAMRAYFTGTSEDAGVSVSSELEKLAQLKDSGVLTPEEFAAQKSKILAS